MDYDIKELEELYNKQVRAYHENRSEQDKLRGALEVQFTEFTKLYDQLPSSVINQFDISLQSPINEMNEIELNSLSEKLTLAYTDLYKKLDKYLRTGVWEEISNTLVEEPKMELPETEGDKILENPPASSNEDSLSPINALYSQGNQSGTS